MEQRMSNSEAEELWRRIKAEMAAAAGSNSGSHSAAIRIKVPESLRPLWEALRSPDEDEIISAGGAAGDQGCYSTDYENCSRISLIKSERIYVKYRAFFPVIRKVLKMMFREIPPAD